MSKTAPKPKPPLTPVDRVLELLKRLIAGFCNEPDLLRVDGQEIAGSFVVAIKASRGDHPKVCGKMGSTFSVIKTLVELCAARHGKRARVTLLNYTEGRSEPEFTPFAPNANWDPANVRGLMSDLCSHVLPAGSGFSIQDVGDLTTIVLTGHHPENLVSGIHSLMHAIGKKEGREIQLIADERTPV